MKQFEAIVMEIGKSSALGYSWVSAWGQSGRKLGAITRIMTSLRSTSTKRRLSLYSSHTGLTTAITLNFGIVDGLRFEEVYQNGIKLLAPVIAEIVPIESWTE